MKKEKQSQGWFSFILSIFAWLGRNLWETDSPSDGVLIDPLSKKFRTPEDDVLFEEVQQIRKRYPHIHWNPENVPLDTVVRMGVLENHFDRRAVEARQAHDGSMSADVYLEGKRGYEKFALLTAPPGEVTFLESLANDGFGEPLDIEQLLNPGMPETA